MNLLENIRANKELNELLMRECDIYFYKEEQEIEFSSNNEVYSLGCMAFAQDGTGSEYVFLEDGSIGFISSEGEVGRVAESLEDLLTFLIHVGCISDFSCKYIYKNVMAIFQEFVRVIKIKMRIGIKSVEILQIN